jgi:hypothetical protein
MQSQKIAIHRQDAKDAKTNDLNKKIFLALFAPLR